MSILERFTLYESAFPMVTYRVILAKEVMTGDSILVPSDLDRDNVELSFMGDPFQTVERSSQAMDLSTIYLSGGEVLRLNGSVPVILDVTNEEEA